jgi:hypothetical protein
MMFPAPLELAGETTRRNHAPPMKRPLGASGNSERQYTKIWYPDVHDAPVVKLHASALPADAGQLRLLNETAALRIVCDAVRE